MQTTSHQPQGEENEQSFVDKIADTNMKPGEQASGSRVSVPTLPALAKGKEQSEQAAQTTGKPIAPCLAISAR